MNEENQKLPQRIYDQLQPRGCMWGVLGEQPFGGSSYYLAVSDHALAFAPHDSCSARVGIYELVGYADVVNIQSVREHPLQECKND